MLHEPTAEADRILGDLCAHPAEPQIERGHGGWSHLAILEELAHSFAEDDRAIVGRPPIDRVT